MMRLAIFCLVAIVAALPPPNKYYAPDNVQLLAYENDNPGLGSHKYGFEQSDGTRQEQQGELRNKGSEDQSYAVKGSYSWVGPDGVTYTVNYTADENGYQPEIEQGPGGGIPPGVVASLLG